jgi:4a-hydroxytetrahydrobiopterin dehydratase
MKLNERASTPNAPALDPLELTDSLAQLPAWQLENGCIKRTYGFKDFHQTMDFVTALAQIIHVEDHHPDLAISYRSCGITWTTHSAGNTVTLNDLICAAKADALYAQGQHA